MKTKNVIMPVLAFVVAIGMAFATTPINGFDPEVWMDTPENPCHSVDCRLAGNELCNKPGPFYSDDLCENEIIDPVFKP